MEKKQVVKISPELHKKLKMLALKKDQTLEALVSNILTAAVTK